MEKGKKIYALKEFSTHLIVSGPSDTMGSYAAGKGFLPHLASRPLPDNCREVEVSNTLRVLDMQSDPMSAVIKVTFTWGACVL